MTAICLQDIFGTRQGITTNRYRNFRLDTTLENSVRILLRATKERKTILKQRACITSQSYLVGEYHFFYFFNIVRIGEGDFTL